jgi:hypothetical protein
MSKEALEGVSKKTPSSRRSLMKSALLVLGASVLIQPAGAVFGLTAQDAPKKGDDKTTATSAAKKTDKKNMKKGTTGTKKGGKKKEDTPKKEG